MFIDHNIVIKLHKSGESNSEIAKQLKMNHTTVWKIIKKFQEIGTTLKSGRPRPKTDCSYPPHQGDAYTMHQLLRKDLGVKPFKMLRRQELSDHHVAMRAEKCRKLLQDITEGTLPNLVFTDEKKFDI